MLSLEDRKCIKVDPPSPYGADDYDFDGPGR